MTEILLIAFLGSLLALGYAVIQSLRISRIAVDNKNLERISGYIAEGARAFLNREYLVLLPFVVIVALFLLVANSGALRLQALAFFMGALFSALAGYFGMMVATKANARTAQQAEKGINHALRVAFAGGSVMGMTVVGLALLGITVLITLGMQLFGVDIGTFKNTIFPIVTGFSLGASTVALFACVWAVVFLPKLQMSVLILWVKLKLVFQRMIRVIQQLLLIMLVTMLAMLLVWVQTSLSHTLVRQLAVWFWELLSMPQIRFVSPYHSCLFCSVVSVLQRRSYEHFLCGGNLVPLLSGHSIPVQ